VKTRINIAGAYSKHTEIKFIIKSIPEILTECDITVYDGIRNCSWNGGRINKNIYDRDDITNYYYDNNITVALTLTNPVIDTKDSIGNDILKRFHRTGNTIISVNENLLRYIKDEYPLYKHTRSITSFGNISVPMCDSDYNRYTRLEEMYDYIVPRCEHVFDTRFKTLNQSKYEIMLNDTCVYRCPFYGDHFKKIAEQNRIYKEPWTPSNIKSMKNIEECWLSNKSDIKPTNTFIPESYHNRTRDKLGDTYGMDLTSKQISSLIKQGISNFKITGREMSTADYMSELRTYSTGVITASKDK